MRGGGLSEHVSTYFNIVLETFTDYYPSSTESLLPTISIYNHDENLRTFYTVLFIVLFVLYIFKRVLHLDQMGERPLITMKGEAWEVLKKDGCCGKGSADVDAAVDAAPLTVMQQIMKKCPIFREVYKPTWFWGKSGHIQTCLFGVMQKPHKAVEVSECKPYQLTLKDGSIVSFHVYEALKPHQSGEEITLLICPGIFGSYNKSYVQSTVGAAVAKGYRFVCLDHLGVLEDVPLKAPRLFTYGSTEEYAAMCDKVFEMYPDSKFIAIGYSMGGNQMCKYMGEKTDRQKKFLAALSICQGYDCIKASIGLARWDKMQVLYSYILTQRWIALVEKHPIVMQAAVERGVNWKDVRACRGLGQFDRHFSTKFYGYEKFEDFMRENSCAQHLDNIDIPLLLLNAIDDPLIGPFYHDIPRAVAERKDNVAFVETHHGGHLGYFENGMFFPREVWIDSAILQFCDNAVNTVLNKGQLPSESPSTSSLGEMDAKQVPVEE